MLARRLINQQSISIDSEEFMVTKLKVCFKDYFVEIVKNKFRKENTHAKLSYWDNNYPLKSDLFPRYLSKTKVKKDQGTSRGAKKLLTRNFEFI
jgi:hypothetical protein